MKLCAVEGCASPHYAKGECRSHYDKRTRPSRATNKPRPTASERFWAKVDKDGPIPEHRPDLGPCWLWTGATSGDGRYGCFGIGRGTVRSHQFSYEEANGPLAEGHEPDHLCKVTLCIRPTHLEAVTHRENVLRGDSPTAINAAKVECIRGHAFTPENTRNMKSGGRACIACERSEEGRAARRDATRRYRERLRQGA